MNEDSPMPEINQSSSNTEEKSFLNDPNLIGSQNNEVKVLDGESGESRVYTPSLDTLTKVQGIGSTESIIASSNTDLGHEPSKEEDPRPQFSRASTDMRSTWSINPKEGEKPTELVKDIRKYPEAGELDKKSEDYKKDRSKLDYKDQIAMKQGDQGVYALAEQVKILNSIKKYEQDLRNGIELQQKDIDILLENHLSKDTRYVAFKKSYESKNLTDEDKKVLLDSHFKDEKEKYLTNLKKDDKYSSANLGLDELILLRDTYKKELISGHAQDLMARQQTSREGYEMEERKRQEDEFKKQNPDWTPAFAREEQAKQIAEMENSLLIDKVNQLEQGTNPTPEPSPIPTPEPTPEPLPKPNPEKDPITDRRKERNLKIATFVGGVIVGGTVGVLGGAAVAAPVAATCGFVNLLSLGAKKFTDWRLSSLNKKLESASNLEDKAKIDKKIKTNEKVQNILNSKAMQYFKLFTGGVAIGAGASTILSNLFFDGKPMVTIDFGNGSAPVSNVDPNAVLGGEMRPPKEIVGQYTGTGTEVNTPFDPGLIKDGRVNLPGSAWNGNLANDPIGTLPNGAMNHSNFYGGDHEMGAWMLNKDLAEAKISADQLTNAMGTDGVHQLLNTYQQASLQGTDPNLTTILENMSSSKPGLSSILNPQ